MRSASMLVCISRQELHDGLGQLVAPGGEEMILALAHARDATGGDALDPGPQTTRPAEGILGAADPHDPSAPGGGLLGRGRGRKLAARAPRHRRGDRDEGIYI